jgi:diguanylate cyclase (GGDEF)-like protein
MFLERLSWTLKLAQRNNTQSALLQIGLDRFKQINDTLGHEAGDAVLKAVAQKLASTLRESDTIGMLGDHPSAMSVSRLAGDEFMVLITDISNPEAASAIARRLLDTMKISLMVGEHELFVTFSVGIALFPQDGTEGSDLLTNVGLAMAQAKLRGRNAYSFCSAEINARSFERFKLETALRRAIEQEELELHYQPKVDLNTGRIVGAEALARWNHATLGQISPVDVSPLAEETGMIMALGDYLLHAACREAMRWRQAGRNVPVSVNVSSMQFRGGNVPSIIHSALSACGLPPQNLIIELTESLLMDNAQENIDMLLAIKKLGVRLSMDDFGTGYSSLSYLKQFPLDEIKIDQSFIHGLPEEASNAAIVSSIISMARGLGLKVTAEGVESQDQMEFLIMHGCDLIQGFFFSKALDSDEFNDFLQRDTNCFSSPDIF